MIKPKKLKIGDTIGIVSPSYWLDKTTLYKTQQYLIDKGFKVVLGESTIGKDGPFAGSPQLRANDINQMFDNNEINAIMCSRGGYGSNKVLPLLDYLLIKNNPKIFMGFSDVTSCLISISQKSKLITFHGPMLSSFKKKWVPYNYNGMIEVLSGNKDIIVKTPDDLPSKTIKAGKGSGKLCGGNMTLIINRIGTDDELDTRDCILFIEDVGEYLYAFERNLIHMKNAGVFTNLKGLIFGELTRFKDQTISYNKTINEIILDTCDEFNYPIISNFPCGHGLYQYTMPIYVNATILATETNPILKIIEAATLED